MKWPHKFLSAEEVCIVEFYVEGIQSDVRKARKSRFLLLPNPSQP
jgi:hypothetical protein